MTPDELRAARKSLGLTQKQMAERLFMSREHYNALEGGRLKITDRVAAMVGMLAGQ